MFYDYFSTYTFCCFCQPAGAAVYRHFFSHIFPAEGKSSFLAFLHGKAYSTHNIFMPKYLLSLKNGTTLEARWAIDGGG